jgi:hypothetical protein
MRVRKTEGIVRTHELLLRIIHIFLGFFLIVFF